MADTIGHLLLTFGGIYKSTDTETQPEIWACGYRMWIGHTEPDPVGSLEATFSVVNDNQNVDNTEYTAQTNWRLEGGVNDFDPISYLVDQGRAAAFAFLNCTAISAYAQIAWLKLAFVGTNGKQVPPPGYAQGAPAILTYKDGYLPNGNGSSNLLPPQIAVVAGHRTLQTGKKGKGRVYRPAIDANSVTAGGLLASDAQTAILNSEVATLEALSINDAPDMVVRPAVISRTGSGGSGTLSLYSTISSVRVGNVMDTQRRRRNQLTETYANGTVTY